MPTVIQWDGDVHPAERLEDRGCDVVKLDGFSSAPGIIAPALAALGLGQTLALAQADHARLVATIRSPLGIRTIAS